MSAKGDIKFTISGLGNIKETAISGINIYHGVNMIPYATLYLNVDKVKEQDKELLCNPDKYKSKDKIVYINVKTKNGCIKFEGYLDGINFTQTVGDISYTASLKSRFQTLVETYPRFLGLMPGSYSPFKAPNPVTIEQRELFRFIGPVQIGAQTIDPGQKIAKYVAEGLKAIVKNQLRPDTSINAVKPHYVDIIDNQFYKKNIQLAAQILEKLDTSATDKGENRGQDCATWLLSMFNGEFSTVWDMMVAIYDQINCVLVCGNEKIFVVPKAQFLKYREHNIPNQRQQGNQPNQANPADFNSLVINDIGHINIRYCLNEVDANQYENSPFTFLGRFVDQPGKYIAEPTEVADSAAGLYVNPLSIFALNNLNHLPGGSNQQSGANGNTPSNTNITIPNSPSDGREKLNQLDDSGRQELDSKIREKLDKYAKIAFLSKKFEDRTGSFTMTFDPKWVPGATASVYTRIPGLFFQGYVTNVTHDIKLHVPTGLEVTTYVNMNCIRQAGSTDKMQGVEDDGFYNYASEDMEAFWNNWLNDVTK